MKVLGLKVLVAVNLLCISITGCIVKPGPPPPPPLPEVQAAISTAKTVFVSNVGEDEVAAANVPGGANACYNTFYASLQQWGHYKLVGSPNDADLVFEISATEKHWDRDPNIVGVGDPPSNRGVIRYPAIITLKVEDNLTRSTLWKTQVEFLSGAIKQKTKVREFNEAIEVLTNRLKEMSPGPYATADH